MQIDLTPEQIADLQQYFATSTRRKPPPAR